LSDKTFASVAVQVKGTQSGGAGLWGVVCASLIDPSSNAATGYLFALIPGNQAWFMARVESSNDQPLLAQGTSSAIHATGANVLRAECRGSGAGKTTSLAVQIKWTTVKPLQGTPGSSGA